MSSADSRGPLTSKANTLKNDVVLIFDLDGTILSVNSFPKWVLFMMKGDFKGIGAIPRLMLAVKTFIILALRKSGLMDHKAAKQHFQKAWTAAIKKDPKRQALNVFIDELKQRIRPNIQCCLDLMADDKDNAILATAAAGEYARGLGEDLGFKHILTTPSFEEGLGRENVREEKRDRVLALLEEKNWNDKIRIFFTDHEEDLAMVKESHITLWFGPTDKAAHAKTLAPDATIIACQDLTEQAVLSHLKGFLV